MAVSWYIPTIQRLADPSKHGRLYYQLSPLFGRHLDWLSNRPFTHMLETTQSYAGDERFTRGITQFFTYHEELRKELPRLRGKKVIFLPGVTIDRADENPAYLGVDYACPRNRLTEKILFSIQNLRRSFNWDVDVHFLQVQPLALPFHAKEGKLVHSLEDAVRATEVLADKPFGNLVRDPASADFQQGIYQYSRTLFDSAIAKEAYGETLLRFALKHQEHVLHNGPGLDPHKLDELKRWFGGEKAVMKATREDMHHHIEKDIQFNKRLMAAAYATIIEDLGLDKVHYFITKTSPEMSIIDTAAKLAGVPLDSWGKGIMRNAKMSRLREADDAAVRLLEGKLYSWDPKPQLSTLRRFTEEEPQYARCQQCPDLREYRCPVAGLRREDKERSSEKGYVPKVTKCACDFAQNKFTLEDVTKVVQAKYGKNPLVTPQDLFDELRFKNIRYLDEDGKIRKANELDIWRNDTRMQGWTANFIADDLQARHDAFIVRIGEKGERETQSWRLFVGDEKLLPYGILATRGEVKPLKVPASRPDYYSIRPSEFSSSCVIGRILSKVDPAKVLEQEGVEIIPHVWGVSGTIRHRLALWRPWVDYAGKDIPVWDYTEREVWTSFANPDGPDIRVFGHADAFAWIEGPRPMPIVFDYKRSPNEKASYHVQLMLYRKGLERALDTRFDEAVLWLVNRPHFSKLGEAQMPVHHYAYVDARSYDVIPFPEFNPLTETSRMVSGLEELVVSSYLLQSLLAREKHAYLQARSVCSKTVCESKDGTCGHPFNKQLCDTMAGIVRKGGNVQDFLYDGVVL